MSSLDWPTENPTRRDFREWRHQLQRITSDSYALHRRLGAWISPAHRGWPWRYDQENDHLYCWKDGYWHRYEPISNQRLRHGGHYTRRAVSNHCPNSLQLASIQRLPSGYVCLESSVNPPPPPPTPPSSLKDLLGQWGQEWVWKHIDGYEDSDTWLSTALRNGTAVLICDGSYQPQLSETLGGAAWIIECMSTGRQIRGVLPSTTRTANAYRSELVGLYGSLAFILAVCTVANIDSGSLKVGCDNEKALFLTSKKSQHVPQTKKHADILRAIRKVRCTIPINLIFEHIRGHQDETIPLESLDRPAQLNVECDILAKMYVRTAWHHQWRCPESLPHENVRV